MCLEDGQQWSNGFMDGLARSWVFLPIISDAAIRPMVGIDERTSPDNVLLEWLGALEFFARGQVKGILPVISPASDGTKFSFSLVDELSKAVHEPTLTAAKKHLGSHMTSKGLDGDDLLNGAEDLVADAYSRPSSSSLRYELEGLGLDDLIAQAAPYGLDEDTLKAIAPNSENPISTAIELLVGKAGSRADTRGIASAILHFQGVKLAQRNDTDGVRKELAGLKMGEISSQAAEYGIDSRKVQAVANDSDDPIKAAVDFIVSEARKYTSNHSGPIKRRNGLDQSSSGKLI